MHHLHVLEGSLSRSSMCVNFMNNACTLLICRFYRSNRKTLAILNIMYHLNTLVEVLKLFLAKPSSKKYALTSHNNIHCVNAV